MIMFGALLVCLAVTGVFYFIDRNRYLWWEFFIPVATTLLIIFGMKALVEHSSVQFTEYWGETMVSVYEEEPYNYWKVEICSRSVPCGTDKDGNTEYCTEYYDCSHQEDVGPSWWCKTDLGKEYYITEQQYDSIRILWQTSRKVIKSHDNYAPRDRCVGSKGTKFEGKIVGDVSYVWQTNWPGTDPTRKGYFTKHQYENRIKASDLSLFNISVVNKKQADSLGLYDYPDIDGKAGNLFGIAGNNVNYPTILGPNISKQTQENFRKLNAKFGPKNELRLWVLVFDNKPATIAAYQENYWVRGNQNELVICIGTKGKEITWAHSFSWALSGDLTAEVTQKVLDLYTYSIETKSGQNVPIAVPMNTKLKEIVRKGTGIDTTLLPPVLPLNIRKGDITTVTKSKTPVLTEETWERYYNYLNENLNRFQRRNFEEFSYLKVVPKTWVVILLYILALGISIGINFWTFNNEFNEEGKNYNARSGYYSRTFNSKFRRY